jgi:RNA polymerase sigma-70 factor (ECF subfamily)
VETQASAAVEELHRLHSKNVYRYVYRRLLDVEVARQITNDAFRLAWQRGITPGDDALPWLLVTARNLVGNELRSMGREKNLVLKAAAARLAERSGRDSGLDEQVHEVLEALRAKDREVLILAYWDALPMAEIAAVLECSHESAKSRLFRARKAFERKAPTSMLKGGSSHGQH